MEDQLGAAARRGDRAAVIFGSLHEPPGADPLGATVRQRVAGIARDAGMAVCGAGCMGFVNVTYGLRAIGYVEHDPLPHGPVALVTHSGSVFSALLRTRRRLGFTLAVSSGQELVTTTADYVQRALDDPATRVVGLVLEALRDGPGFRAALARAAEADVAVVALTVGGSPTGRAMVAAHSGALAGDDGAWEALFDAYGVARVRDLDELADTLELLSSGRRAAAGGGIATVHDSGAERALVVDVADAEGVPFTALAPATTARLAEVLEPGLPAANPLDVWGTGADTEGLFTTCLRTVAADPGVAAVALAVDLVHELDGDESYPRAAAAAASSTPKPVAVLSNLGSGIDPEAADWLRARGVPVLEGTRSGLRALGHLLALRERRPKPDRDPERHDRRRRARWLDRLTAGPLGTPEAFELLADYGIPCAASGPAASADDAVSAAERLGYPVVLKTDEPGIAHKSDVGGVVLGLANAGEVRAAYTDLADRLGTRVLVSATAPGGVELSLGVVSDRALGPLVVVGAGGTLVEFLADRSVGLPPLDPDAARAMVGRLRVSPLLGGAAGPPRPTSTPCRPPSWASRRWRSRWVARSPPST